MQVLTLLSIAGAALIVMALVLHAAENVKNRQIRKRAELIRLRLQEEPSAHAYRKIQIRLSGN